MPGRPPLSGTVSARVGVEIRSGSVKEARTAKGLTLAQLGGSELTRAAVHRIETGRSRPSIRSLGLIAQRTDRPLSFFLAGSSPEQSTPEVELGRLAAEAKFDELIARATPLLEVPSLDAHTQAVVHYWLGEAHVRLTQPEIALEHLEQALRAVEEQGDPWLFAQALHMKSSALYLMDDPEALLVAEEALRRCRLLDPAPPMLEARVLNHLAAIAVNREEWQQAIRLYDRALVKAEPLRDLRQLSLMYEGLGMAHNRLGRTAQANDYFSRSLALYSLQADMSSLARAEVNLSELLVEQGAYSSAEQHLRQSLRYCDEHGVDRRNRTYAIVNLAKLRLRQERLEEVDELTRQAIELGEDRGELLSLATAYQIRAQLSIRNREFAEADSCYQRAIELYAAMRLVDRLRACLIEHAEELDNQDRVAEAKRQWRLAALAGRDYPDRLTERIMGQA